MECQTVSHTIDGVDYLKDKVKYNDLAAANSEAKRISGQDGQLYKMVGYKCSECGFYHIGTSDKAKPRKF